MYHFLEIPDNDKTFLIYTVKRTCILIVHALIDSSERLTPEKKMHVLGSQTKY